MPVNEAFVGRSYPPSEVYRVSREKVREFADAINDPNPACRSVETARALGYPDVVAPPTFAIVLSLPAGYQFSSDPEAGVDYSRVVHGEQRFVHERPIVAGDELQAVLTIESIRVAAGNELIGNRVELRTVTGELVTTAYATTVVRREDDSERASPSGSPRNRAAISWGGEARSAEERSERGVEQ